MFVLKLNLQLLLPILDLQPHASLFVKKKKRKRSTSKLGEVLKFPYMPTKYVQNGGKECELCLFPMASGTPWFSISSLLFRSKFTPVSSILELPGYLKMQHRAPLSKGVGWDFLGEGGIRPAESRKLQDL